VLTWRVTFSEAALLTAHQNTKMISKELPGRAIPSELGPDHGSATG